MKKIIALVAASLAAQAGAAFRCVDEKGLTHIGDTPPPACASVMMYEISKSGQVLRRIEPTLTPEQVRQREAEQARKLEADRRAAEQKRADSALMQTFSSEKEFDVVRDRNIEPLQRSIRISEERLKEVEKREKTLADELEFYQAGKSGKGKAREAPRPLLEEQERLASEKKNINRAIAGYNKEIGDIKVKFEADKKRWVALKSNAGRIPDNVQATPVVEKPRK